MYIPVIFYQLMIQLASSLCKANMFALDSGGMSIMLRLGSYRKTKFSGRYGEVVSVPTKAQREIFTAFGIMAS